MMTVTEKWADYRGIRLVNPDPGVSDAVDYLGRNIGNDDTDFMGRALVDQPSASRLPAEFPIVLEGD